MNNSKSISPLFLCCLALVLVFVGCTDERTTPTKPVDHSYTETYELIDRQASAGQEISVSIPVRDALSDGTLNIYCFIKADADLDLYEDLGVQASELTSFIADTIDARLGVLEYLEQIDSLTVNDSLELDSLRILKTSSRDSIFVYNQRRDSLDVLLDDRFKLTVKLNDGDWFYPNSVVLNNATLRNDTMLWSDTLEFDYLDDTTMYVWGQGAFLSETDTDGWKGKRVSLDLVEFWAADVDYLQVRRPVRSSFLVRQAGESPTDPYARYELLPVRGWVDDIVPGGTNTLHIKLGSPGTTAEISATLYAVHKTEG